ncbi:MAG: galactokinase [Lentisphaerae bacterium]|nr:galactokinase [Lentisphaerota bacterium]
MQQLIRKFTGHFNMPPAVAAQAPGRLEVLGNHTDYNEGFVLSCAVGQTTNFVLAPVSGSLCTVKDFRDGSEMHFDLAALDSKPPRNGSKYIIGMLNELRKRGFTPFAFNAALESHVPLSAGMSSSAALEVACALAFVTVANFTIDRAELARAGQGVENNFLGLKTGLLDQFSSLFGKRDSIIMSDFRTVEVLGSHQLPAGYSFVVVNSMKKHTLVDSDYNIRRQDCESAASKLAAVYPGAKTLRDITPEQLANAKDKLTGREFRRAAHVVGECDRVKRAAELLAKGDVTAFGKLLFDSHDSSMINFENSTAELDTLVDIARKDAACLGARLSGGGFGGITIHLVKSDDAGSYAQRVKAAYLERTGIEAECFICSLGDGAKIVEF